MNAQLIRDNNKDSMENKTILIKRSTWVMLDFLKEKFENTKTKGDVVEQLVRFYIEYFRLNKKFIKI